jgi:hypothetical protein
MILFLRLLFALVLVSMLGVTTWASLECPLFAVPRDVFGHPWFIATLFDAYWGFITFFAWVCYKQNAWLARVTWLVAILLLGNIAMASYCLAELARPDAARGAREMLVARRDGVGFLGPILATIGVGVIGFALVTSR